MASFDVSSTTTSVLPSSMNAVYSCQFDNLWSGSRHPVQYPSNAHWSPPVLLAHSDDYQMWGERERATRGVEDVAETGSTARLAKEIRKADGTGESVQGDATFNRDTQMQTFDDIMMTSEYSYMSTITMIAPSPDWFSGFYDFSAIDDDEDCWYEEFVIETYPWDAGTEMGDTYSTDNDAEKKNKRIMRLTANTPPSTTNQIFLDDETSGTEVLPVARWTCTLQNECAGDGKTCSVASDCCAGDCVGNVCVPPPNFVVDSTTTSSLDSSSDAEYECVFQNMWSGMNHPVQYPSNAHWSPPVLAAHSDRYQMWAPGEEATKGVERVAETGDTKRLIKEISKARGTGDYVVGGVTFNRDTQMQTFDNIMMTSEYSYLSTITMIAPSPDWFSGFYDFSAIDEDADKWYSEFVIDTYPWDAGTEMGVTYDTDNKKERDGEIHRLTAATAPSNVNGVFLDAAMGGTMVKPVARWTCTLQETS